MTQPIVAIVGRPNVGKSAFFNYLAGRRISIVEDTPGVTRDRIYAKCDWRNREFMLIDTGGIETSISDEIYKHMQRQAEVAIDTADVIIFMTDVKSGLTAGDREVAALLHKSGKPVVIAVNKVDTPGDPPAEIYEFYNLGLAEIFPVSALHGLGIGELLDYVFEHLPDENAVIEEHDSIHVAIIGKPNSGKSSLLNRIVGEERAIVSPIAGTTRDALDSLVIKEEKKYTFIDTAGIRKSSKIFSKIAGYAHEQGKAVIVALNKWDLVEKDNKTFPTYVNSIRSELPFMQYAPVIAISSLTGKRVENLFPLIDRVYENRRIPTGVLNDVLNEAVAMVQPPSDKGRLLRIYYMTQASSQPPTFVMFVNDKELMHFSYERYITNTLRETFDFEGTPIRFIVRERGKEN